MIKSLHVDIAVLILYLRDTQVVITLFFTLIFRPFSQPCHLHTCSLLSRFSCHYCFPPCFRAIALLFDPQFLWILMIQWLYPLSYSSFTLSNLIDWGPGRFLRDFWWLYTNYTFQREVSSPSLSSSVSSSPSSERCPPSLDLGVTFPSTTVGTKAVCIV